MILIIKRFQDNGFGEKLREQKLQELLKSYRKHKYEARYSTSDKGFTLGDLAYVKEGGDKNYGKK